MPQPKPGWTVPDWLRAYQSQAIDLTALGQLVQAFSADDPAWISVVTPAALQEQLADLVRRFREADGDWARFPLFGVPVAVKDNIDVAQTVTTAACPAFAYTAAEDAEVVARLRRAGAIFVGKTNLDQFATGLVGTRSPYGIVPNCFRPEFIGGGSSSGSASVVSRGLVPLALGTDTAGSGRVPAALQNIVGWKPTRGAVSARGVVPACRTLDCVSVFALTVPDAEVAARVIEGFDPADPFARRSPGSSGSYRPARIGVPAAPRFFGDEAAERAFQKAVELLRGQGLQIVELDMQPFHDLAELLYSASWVVERALVAGDLVNRLELLDPTVGRILAGAARHSAADVYQSEYRRAALARSIALELERCDVLCVPTIPRVFRLSEIEADPIGTNSTLGTYTNFTNLADLAGWAIPGPPREDGLPSGVTFLTPAFRERGLAAWVHEFHGLARATLGATDRRLSEVEPAHELFMGSDWLELVVVGAHMTGMPLASAFRSLGGVFARAAVTAPFYELHLLPGGPPQRPGLKRVEESLAHGIAVEVWKMPREKVGAFLETIPWPLGLGSIQLEGGEWVRGFICEPAGFLGAKDISGYGGFRAFVQAQAEGA
jgi:allophanate hydrolase